LKGQRKPKEREVPGHWRKARDTANPTAVFGKITERVIKQSVVDHLRRQYDNKKQIM